MYGRRGDLGDDALGPAAHHEILVASRGGDSTRAVARARRAAGRAVSRAAYEEAAALLERAVNLLEARGGLDGNSACELLLEWGEALVLSGLGPRGRDVCARAAALAKSLGDGPLVVRAALVYGSEILTGVRDERMIALLRDALVAVGPDDSALRARVMARLAAALIPTPKHDREPAALAVEALRMARQSGVDPMTTLNVLQSYCGAMAFRSGTAERRALVGELLDLARKLDKPAVIASSLPWAMADDLELFGMEGFERRFADLQRLVERLSQPYYRARIPIARLLRASLECAWEEADRQIRETEALAEDADVPQPRFWLAVALLGHHHARRDAAAFRRDQQAMLTVFERWHSSGRLFKALVVAIGADVGVLPMAEARALVQRDLREMLATMEIQGVPPAAGVAAWAAVLVGDHEVAESLSEALAAQNAMGNRLIMLASCAAALGPTVLLLAETAALLGRSADARALYEEAIEHSERIGARVYADRARLGRSKLGDVAASVSAPPVAPAITSAPTPPSEIALTQQGEVWTLRAGAESWNLKPSKGISYLSLLMAQPHEEIHVAQLVGAGDAITGDAGPQLDERAKASYRRRAADLRAEIDEATASADLGRLDRARAELEALGEELARAVGLGGRDRKAASDVERMRVNVQRRLRDAIERVRAQSPSLGQYLDASVRTGSFCSYSPAWTTKAR
jgi:hypothetical protein